MVGQKAGAYLATWLLCRELEQLGLNVTCFAQHASWEGPNSRRASASATNSHSFSPLGERTPQTMRSPQARPNRSSRREEAQSSLPCPSPLSSQLSTLTSLFPIVRPLLRKGCRWDWPGRCLAGQARRRIRREQPDFVVVVGVTSLARYLLQSNVANRLLVWELTNANPGNKFVDPEASRLLSRCRAMLSPSKTIDQNIRQTYGYEGPLLRLPFWIEESYQPFNSSTLQPFNFLFDFLFLGRRDVEKGLNELIRATAEVAKSFPSLRVLIAGTGNEEPFATLCRNLGVAQNVSFRFFPTREETLAALAQARCLVLPSYHEGYPLVLLEAAQRGIPFIATRVGSAAEVFEGTGAGLIVPPRDDQALANAMLAVLAEAPDQYAARRAAAYAVFRKISSAETVRYSLTRLLESVPPSAL